MICDICHQNIATMHLTEIVNDKVVEMHICQVCAQSKAKELQEQINISGFLGGLLGMEDFGVKGQTLKCPKCGFSYADFKKKGRLGCSHCYVTFKQLLLPLLKKIHSAVRHTGRSPAKKGRKEPAALKVERLRLELSEAIKHEEYEQAAKLRDEIKKITKEKE